MVQVKLLFFMLHLIRVGWVLISWESGLDNYAEKCQLTVLDCCGVLARLSDGV